MLVNLISVAIAVELWRKREREGERDGGREEGRRKERRRNEGERERGKKKEEEAHCYVNNSKLGFTDLHSYIQLACFRGNSKMPVTA